MRRLILIAATLVIASAGAAFWLHRDEASAAPQKAPPAAAPAIPATIGLAERKDVPVYLTAPGTVQAFNTVTVKVRVDGQLEKVDFTEGQDVKAGDVLAQIDPRPFRAALDLAQATKAKDQAQLANAKLDLNRYVTGGPLVNTQQQIDTQRALVQQLEATVQADQANIDAAQVQLDYTTVKAPLSGRTGVRLVDQGNIVHAADTTGLVVITQLQPISVIFTLPQDQLQEVIHEMRAAPDQLKVYAQARTGGRQPEQGTLQLVDNLIDQTTGSVRLKATFPNKDYALWPGQYVSVRLLLQTLPQAVTVPSSAIQRGPDGAYVYLVKPDSTVALQPVDVGQSSDGTSVIDKGIDAGAKIVTAGQYRLSPGSRVQDTEMAGRQPQAEQRT